MLQLYAGQIGTCHCRVCKLMFFPLVTSSKYNWFCNNKRVVYIYGCCATLHRWATLPVGPHYIIGPRSPLGHNLSLGHALPIGHAPPLGRAHPLGPLGLDISLGYAQPLGVFSQSNHIPNSVVLTRDKWRRSNTQPCLLAQTHKHNLLAQIHS